MKYEAYLDSPYRYKSIGEKAYVTKSNEEVTTNLNTGEMFVLKKIANNKLIMHDSLVYTKLFQDSIPQLCSMGSGAIKVLLYAMATVKPLSETVVLNGPDVMLFCGIGKSTFYDSIIELLDKKVLCKKLGSSIEFWYDPNVFFNGNRIRMVSKSNNSRLNLENEV
jgi:predicted DNA-binding transcriptional regulator AlpA